MNILEFAAATFSPQLPDGRFVFRPWGARGPCYLLSARQRTVRGGMQLAFYALAAAALFFVPIVTAAMNNLIVFAVVFMLSNYVLYWLFSIGLPKIENPPPMTAEQRRTVMTAYSKSLGRPVLWVLLTISCLFVLAGGAIAVLTDEWWVGLLSMGFFGTCAAMFAWQLLLVAKKSKT